MSKLPVIVGFGGINAAGRSSGFHSYKRLVHDVLNSSIMENTWLDLANRMSINISNGLNEAIIKQIQQGTLVRKIDIFDPFRTPSYHNVMQNMAPENVVFKMLKSRLPATLPENWAVKNLDKEYVEVTVSHCSEMLLPITKSLEVSTAGTIPFSFDPGMLYHSTHHPRNIKLAVYGISDALNSMGVSWEEIERHTCADEISVYVGSALSQSGQDSLTELAVNYATGKRFSVKMLVFSLSEMPADFINSYVINSVGSTGTNSAACATFLYNLKLGIHDIQSSKARVAIVGATEAPVNPEIIAAFSQMGALAKDADLCKLDGSNAVDYRRACRPFSTNTGFIISESSQFLVLMEDSLALELGLNIYGGVPDVFVSADANKKSITSPGIGNYLTMSKAVAAAKSLLGNAGIQRSYVHAHGTGTPQNRISESHILNEVAKSFNLGKWPICAVKSYVGHSVAAAGGDQILAALGAWHYGWIPGITTINHIASDVYQTDLNILMEHKYIGDPKNQMDVCIINSKGFGGNNASAVLLSPEKTREILVKKFGKTHFKQYFIKNDTIQESIAQADLKSCRGNENMIYQFGESVMQPADVTISATNIIFSKLKKAIQLPTESASGALEGVC